MSLLLVCSGGGHLKQLHELVERLPFPHKDRTWVTFDTGLSRSLLEDEDVVYATYAAPRDVPNIARNAVLAVRLLRRQRWSAVVSTGSSLAVDFLPLAALRGIPSYFIETAARASGPSMTGRILARAPRVATYTQYPAWAGGHWRYAGSIFDGFTPAEPVPAAPIRRAVVTVGTTESYGFRRMIEALTVSLRDVDTVWQTGATDVSGLDIPARATVPHGELVEAIATADVVISHAGTGAALTALEAGRCPVLVPRLRRHGEHVDDHQVQIAAELLGRGLAVVAAPDELGPDVLQQAARRRVDRLLRPPALDLGS
jgi:UDP-N-acetylglucosamine--N-acetylmuramyl-(pentapeptide) pyrophosphoryl-undecaprenol N-acetylglucosamine transferase